MPPAYTMLTLITRDEVYKMASGLTILVATFLFLIVLSRKTVPSSTVTIMPGIKRWRFRPGTWFVWGLQVLAMYGTCLYRGFDAFVVVWRETKTECLAEHLDCED